MKNYYDYIKIFANVIPEEHLEFLNKYSLDHKDNTSPALIGFGPMENQSENLEYRNTNWITTTPDLRYNIESGIRSLYNESLQSVYGREIVSFEPAQILHYPLNGKYDTHNDCEIFVDGNLKRSANRDISVICFLNDDYEGGELEFTLLGLKITPKRGMIITFPSYFEFTHRVHPVTRGDRFSVVAWIETNEPIYSRKK